MDQREGRPVRGALVLVEDEEEVGVRPPQERRAGEPLPFLEGPPPHRLDDAVGRRGRVGLVPQVAHVKGRGPVGRVDRGLRPRAVASHGEAQRVRRVDDRRERAPERVGVERPRDRDPQEHVAHGDAGVEGVLDPRHLLARRQRDHLDP